MMGCTSGVIKGLLFTTTLSPADFTTHCKHTRLYGGTSSIMLLLPITAAVRQGDGEAFSPLRYRPRAGRRVWARPSEKENDWGR